MSAYVVGITGSIATGKTNVTDALIKHGACVVDADVISRDLTKKSRLALFRILLCFGPGVFSSLNPLHPALNRKKLGEQVFSAEQKRLRLNRITHPMILRRCRRALKRAHAPVVFLSAPLLFECGMEKMCHEIWCTYVSEDEQLRRLTAREGITAQDALLRIRSQMPALKKAQKAHFVIDTSGTRDESARQALDRYQDLLKAHS